MGGEGMRTREEKQRQRRLHTTSKCHLCIKLLVCVFVYVLRELLLSFFLLNMRYISLRDLGRTRQKDLEFSLTLRVTQHETRCRRIPHFYTQVGLPSSECKERNKCTFRNFEHDMKRHKASKLVQLIVLLCPQKHAVAKKLPFSFEVDVFVGSFLSFS